MLARLPPERPVSAPPLANRAHRGPAPSKEGASHDRPRGYVHLVADQKDAVRAGAGPTAVATGTETILFVEDDESVRVLGVRALRRYGYTILPARHEAEALTLAAEHGRIDLLATNLVMPGLNGRVLAERLRQSRGDLKVLYASGHTSDSVALGDILTSGIDFLQKPYTLESLVRTVRGVLDRS